MAEITESFDAFLSRVTEKLVIRLLAIEGSEADVLEQIRMTKVLIRQLEEQLRLLILHGNARRVEILLHEAINGQLPSRPHTWKEIGEALGVSAQAAQRKYASMERSTDG
ncbi:hypothetical protein FXF51_56115 [Nonomuraea sp. PA05]|uniref:hypothetical protein n=1 Tax=Nonomuraea sp. PA05 TaxID=2604466 RepID=UPI0011DB3782|nr:hypothetical protein [Nonomuraea sp. PA05]TYB50488.1 hypothetical protein FXF51_56115 [Nonomuraea sp. PA05]